MPTGTSAKGIAPTPKSGREQEFKTHRDGLQARTQYLVHHGFHRRVCRHEMCMIERMAQYFAEPSLQERFLRVSLIPIDGRMNLTVISAAHRLRHRFFFFNSNSAVHLAAGGSSSFARARAKRKTSILDGRSNFARRLVTRIYPSKSVIKHNDPVDTPRTTNLSRRRATTRSLRVEVGRRSDTVRWYFSIFP